MAHGLSGNKNEAFGLFIKMAGALALNGIAVLRFDGRGHGETGGSTRDITLLRQIEDVSTACDFLRTQAAVDANRLGILGFSMGGLVGACVAGQREDVKALGMWEAPFNLHDTMVRLLGPLTVRSVRSTGYLQVGFIELGVKFFEVIEHFDTAANVTTYRGPVFIGQGTGDQIIPMENAALWQSTFAQNNAEVFLIPEADHVFTKDAWSWPLINKTASWFKDNI
jgi:dienelactone hydrolase